MRFQSCTSYDSKTMFRLVTLCLAIITLSNANDEVFTAVPSWKPLRVLGFFPYNGYSHYVIFQRLMIGLSKRGHQVTVVSPFVPRNPLPNFTHIDLSDILPVKLNALTLEYMASKQANDTVWSMLSVLGKLSGPQLCRDVLSHANVQPIISGELQFDVIFTEIFGSDCFLAIGHKLQIPTISIASCYSLPWTADYVGDIDNPSFVPNLYFEPSPDRLSTLTRRLSNVLSYVKSKVGYHVYITRPTEAVMREYFGDNIPPLSELRNNVSLLMVNTHDSVFGAKPTVPRILPVGGIHIDPPNPNNIPQDIKTWLDASSNGVVYFSLGSLLQAETVPEKMMDALLDGFEKLAPLRILWKFGAAEQKLKDKLPKNVKTAAWLPQIEILDHPNTKGFFTHGGLMGLLEAVYAGVPMIGMPVFADQLENTFRAQELGIAVVLDHTTMTADSVVAAITNVTTDASVRRRAQELSRLFRDRPMSPLDSAIWWTEYVVRHGGAPHLESPTARMPFWQYALLDLVALFVVIPIVFMLVLYVCVSRMLRQPWKRFTNRSGDKKFV